MKEQKLQVFVDIVSQYFTQFNSEDLVIDTPYLSENCVKPKVLDYTGVIGISGVLKGVVYVTASTDMLCDMLQMMKETVNDDMMIDLVGEIANTISGNARSKFGPEFHISVPFVFKGSPASVILPKSERSFIIPINWRNHSGEIVICLQDR